MISKRYKVSDLVRDVPQNSYKMSREQYLEYLERSSAMARSKIAALMATSRWRRMTDEAKGAAVEKIVRSARSRVRGRMKRVVHRKARAA